MDKMPNVEENEKNNSGSGLKIVVFSIILVFVVLLLAKSCFISILDGDYKNPTRHVTEIDRTSIAEDMLRRQADDYKKSFPQQISKEMSLVDLQLTKTDLCYFYEVYDSSFDFDAVPLDGLKDSFVNVLKSQLPFVSSMLENLVQTNRGIIYRFTGVSSGVVKDVRFSCDEITEYINESD